MRRKGGGILARNGCPASDGRHAPDSIGGGFDRGPLARPKIPGFSLLDPLERRFNQEWEISSKLSDYNDIKCK
jgi:hypothetical protein